MRASASAASAAASASASAAVGAAPSSTAVSTSLSVSAASTPVLSESAIRACEYVSYGKVDALRSLLSLASASSASSAGERAVSLSVDAPTTNVDGVPLLHLACLKGHAAVAELLMQYAGVDAGGGGSSAMLASESMMSAKMGGGASAGAGAGAGAAASAPAPVSVGVSARASASLAKSMLTLPATKLLLTPMHFAAQGGDIDVIEGLFQRGAPVDAQAGHGETPLVHALHWLIVRGANISSVDQMGRTPLHYAALNGAIDCCALLIKHGANKYQRDNAGSMPLHLFALGRNYSQEATTFWIRTYGTSINDLLDGKGRSPVVVARENQQQAPASDIKSAIGPYRWCYGAPFLRRFARKTVMWMTFFYPFVAMLIVHAVAPFVHFVVTMGLFAAFFHGVNIVFRYACTIDYPRTQHRYAMVWVCIAWSPMLCFYGYGEYFPTQMPLITIGSAGLLYILYRVHHSEPGVIDDSSYSVEELHAMCKLGKSTPSVAANMCKTCHLVRPLRSKHCAACDRCVAKFDHHCVWVDNCIAINNRPLFFVLITYALVQNFFLTLTIGQIIVLDLASVWGLLDALLARPAHVASFVYHFMFLLFALSLVSEQVFNTYYNVTTNERINRRKYAYLRPRNAFNAHGRGPMHNVRELLSEARGRYPYDYWRVFERPDEPPSGLYAALVPRMRAAVAASSTSTSAASIV